MSRIRACQFGLMSTFTLKNPLWSTFELLHFIRLGEAHSHELKELALCASGSGWAVVGGAKKPLSPGGFIEIPSNTSHYFAPKAGEVLVMVIFHERGQQS